MSRLYRSYFKIIASRLLSDMRTFLLNVLTKILLNVSSFVFKRQYTLSVIFIKTNAKFAADRYTNIFIRFFLAAIFTPIKQRNETRITLFYRDRSQLIFPTFRVPSGSPYFTYYYINSVWSSYAWPSRFTRRKIRMIHKHSGLCYSFICPGNERKTLLRKRRWKRFERDSKGGCGAPCIPPSVRVCQAGRTF